MKLFPENKELDDTIKKILIQIRLSMNGVVSETMENYGIQYSTNYGVSLVRLKEIAKGYDSNHDLAVRLWSRGIRETKILATLLEEPEKVTLSQIQEWMGELDNVDITQQLAMNLLGQLSFSFDQLKNWIGAEEEFVKVAGLILLGRFSMVNKDLAEEEFVSLLDLCLEQMDTESVHVRRAIGRALRQVGHRSPSLKDRVLELVAPLEGKESSVAQWVWQDVHYDLTYFEFSNE